MLSDENLDLKAEVARLQAEIASGDKAEKCDEKSITWRRVTSHPFAYELRHGPARGWVEYDWQDHYEWDFMPKGTRLGLPDQGPCGCADTMHTAAFVKIEKELKEWLAKAA